MGADSTWQEALAHALAVAGRLEGEGQYNVAKISLGVIFLLIALGGCQALRPAVAGGAGIGDSYYPELGNGGYDVQRYVIALAVDPPGNVITGTTTLEAKALTRLSSFNLELQGLTIAQVLVNDEPAEFTRQESEVIITPARSLAASRTFTVMIAYHGSPRPALSKSGIGRMGWFHAEDGTINVVSEPDGASTWYPVNDHPRDKASYRFEILVPKPWMVVATGMLREVIDLGAYNNYTWEMEAPMASYLASINIDEYVVVEAEAPGGIRMRNYFPPGYPEERRMNFGTMPEMIAYFSWLFGEYPFDTYGVVITDNLPFCPGALEGQSLSIHCPDQTMASEYVIAHEIAYQLFGDSVSLENWQDLWLKEGLASYAGWLWEHRHEDLAAFTAYVRERKTEFKLLAPIAQPPTDPLYGAEAYIGGAIFFHALRLQVGDPAFFEALRMYSQEYRGGNANVEEFISVVEAASGQRLDEFFNEWLNVTELPELPGNG